MLKRALISLSLANLWFFTVWGELLTGSKLHYFMDQPPSRAGFVAIVLNVLLLAIVFWLVSNLLNRFPSERLSNLSNFIFIAVFGVALNAVRRALVTIPADKVFELLSNLGVAALLVIVSVSAIFGVWRWLKSLTRFAEVVTLLLAPLVVLTFGQALLLFISYEVVTREFVAPLASPLTVSDERSPRVVLLLFDELDQQIAFDERPAGLQLPELERLQTEAVYAAQAYPVAGETMLAIPALTIGQRVSKAMPVNASTLRITLADTKKTVDWASQPNVFAKARAAGFNTAVVGNMHPYCRVLRSSLTECSSWSLDIFAGVGRHSPVFTLSEIMINQISEVLTAIPALDLLGLSQLFLSQFQNIQLIRDEWSLRMYVGILEETKKMAANNKIGLLFVHFPVPHSPFIYDRTNRKLVIKGNRSYLDNLALVDLTLGEVRRAMERAGTWKNSAVLVTSDHWYREKQRQPWKSQGEELTLTNYRDHRVPLLIKLPGQQRGVTYEAPLNNVIIHDLILALLSKRFEMSGVEVVIRWIDNHRMVAPPLCDEEKNVNHVCSFD